jgi:hypothetical protein
MINDIGEHPPGSIKVAVDTHGEHSRPVRKLNHLHIAECLVVGGSSWDDRCTPRSSSSLRRRLLLLIGGLTSPVLAAG